MILNCPKCNTRFMVDDALIGNGREVKCGGCTHLWFVDPTPSDDALADIAAIPSAKTDAQEADEMIEDLAAQTEAAPEDDTPLEKFDEEEEAPTEEGEAEDASSDSEAEEAEPETAEAKSDEGEADAPAEPGEEEGGMIPEFEEVEGADKETPNFAAPMPAPENIPVPIGQKLVLGGLLAACLVMALFTFRAPIPGMAGVMGMQDTSGVKLADIQVREIPSREKARYVVEGKIINTADEPRKIPTLHVALLDGEGEVIISREYGADKELQPGEDTPFTASKLDTTFRNRLSHILVELGNGVQLMVRN